MDLEVGAVLPGKVTGIAKYGAFVTIAPGKSGLVHISEIASTYVNEVREHLTEGQEVTVKVVGIDQTGRINLSIKAAEPAAASVVAPQRPRKSPAYQASAQPRTEEHDSPEAARKTAFEDKLKRFMQDSDSKMSGIRQYSDKKGSRRRGR